MRKYVFDTSSFRVLQQYYPDRFPSFWDAFNESVESGEVTSVSEVYDELISQAREQHLLDWIASHRLVFQKPTAAELEFLPKIFAIKHFQQLIKRESLLRGGPVADPMLIARAHCTRSCVITEETLVPNGARIPNVCDRFGIACMDLKGFLDEMDWTF